MTTPLRALVVDDEPDIRALLSSALAHENFVCDAAADGDEAWARIQEEQYDLIVMDLAMPCRHGHSLAIDLLAMPQRPLVVVLTGVLDTRIAKDLMGRGIDDIAFKPVHMPPFAAKLRSLADRRAKDRQPPAGASEPASRKTTTPRIARITDEDFQVGLRKVTRIPPVSKAAIEVFNLTLNPEADVAKVAAAVQCEAALLTDILRLANSALFNPSGKKISEAEQAVVRLGQKRIGEVALATAAFYSLTAEKVPFFSLGRIWKKSLAMGLCVEMLSEQVQPGSNTSGLFCAAVMQPMGRVLLASVFPDVYQRMLKHCEFTRKPLFDIESQVFPETPGEVAAKLLASWAIPPEIYVPLKYVSQPFNAINQLSDPLRHRVELVKMAGLLGEIVANEFDPWDLIELPTQPMLKRLGVVTIEPLLKQCAADLKTICSFGTPALTKDLQNRKPGQIIPVAYKRLRADSLDLMSHVLQAAGLRLVSAADDAIQGQEVIIVNALHTAAPQVAARLRTRSPHETVVLADAENEKKLQEYGQVIVLPCSYATLTDAFARIADMTPTRA